MADIKFGEIEGVKEGDIFESRRELTKAGVHRNTQQGIDGNRIDGTAAIVLSGGYSDDEDYGDEIIYTGHGGFDDKKKQYRDQSLDDYGNKGLLISELHGLPVRVIRGDKHKSKYSPQKGYKYGGLYQVIEHFWKDGIGGKYRVCIFKLVKLSSLINEIPSGNIITEENTQKKPARILTTLLRIVRDTAISRQIKILYDYTCQVCGTRISYNGIGYAEAAHIRPLGNPHNGDDALDNLLCLCPNHHVMFDKWHFTIKSDFSYIGLEGRLIVHNKHNIKTLNLTYHNEHFLKDCDRGK